MEHCIGRLKKRWPVLQHCLRFRDMAKCSKAIEVYIALYNFILKEEGDLDDFEDDDTIQPPTLHVASDKTATCDKIMEKYYKD